MSRFATRIPIVPVTLLAAVVCVTAVAVATQGSGTPASGHQDADRSRSTTQAARPTADHGLRPITVAEFDLLKKSALFSDDDVRALRMSRAVLEPHVDELLSVWYGFVGANPHLLAYFADPETGTPDSRYLDQVRVRFRQWVLDTADARFDQAWLDRQLELGVRHHRLGKNRTDNVDAADHIHFRHLVALHHPITATLGPFLSRGEHTPDEVAAMHEAWRKAVLMTVILWSQPYVTPGDF